jgi:hypothetical protein
MNHRLRLALIVVVFFGVPALLTLGLIHSDRAQEAQRGLQSGGTIRGRVLGPDGEGLAGVALALLLDPSTGEAPEAIEARATSGPDGRFELQATGLDGRYTVVAGGGIWRHAARAFSFIGRSPDEEFTLRVEPGCELEVQVARSDGGAAGAGSFVLEGRPQAGWFSVFGEPELRREGRLEDGRVRVDALPPMHARLFVRLETGESIELELDLEPGRTQRDVRL